MISEKRSVILEGVVKKEINECVVKSKQIFLNKIISKLGNLEKEQC